MAEGGGCWAFFVNHLLYIAGHRFFFLYIFFLMSILSGLLYYVVLILLLYIGQLLLLLLCMRTYKHTRVVDEIIKTRV